MVTFTSRTHIDAVVDLLAAAGMAVGDGQAPDTNPPYVIVHSVRGGRRSGPMGDAYADVDYVVQVTCVGRSRREAQWRADQAEVAMATLRGTLVDGRTVVGVEPDMPSGVERDDTTAGPPLFYSTPRWTITSAP